jgi:hypothetical protein
VDEERCENLGEENYVIVIVDLYSDLRIRVSPWVTGVTLALGYGGASPGPGEEARVLVYGTLAEEDLGIVMWSDLDEKTVGRSSGVRKRRSRSGRWPARRSREQRWWRGDGYSTEWKSGCEVLLPRPQALTTGLSLGEHETCRRKLMQEGGVE